MAGGNRWAFGEVVAVDVRAVGAVRGHVLSVLDSSMPGMSNKLQRIEAAFSRTSALPDAIRICRDCAWGIYDIEHWKVRTYGGR